jgi:hypothetical protein
VLLLMLLLLVRLQEEEATGATAAAEEEERPACCGWLYDFGEWLEDLTLRKLYAWNFCLETCFSLHLMRWRRCVIFLCIGACL